MIATSGKVKLRNKKVSDALKDYAWQSDPVVAELDAAIRLNISFTDYLSYYMGELRNPSRDRCMFAVDTLDDKHIGNCVYYNINEGRGEAELGVMIGDRDNWDKGFGSDAVHALVDYVFGHNGFKRIYLKTLESNLRAQRCFQKCGFTPYDRMSRDGYRFLLMEMHRSRWEESRGTENQEPGVIMSPDKAKQTLIQCDFDGTITMEDISFLILDEFAEGNWRELLEDYRQGKIPVGDFNTRAFAMVKADRQSMIDLVRRTVRMRLGFRELLEYSKKNNLRFVIVSNGLDFYIETILSDLGVNHGEVFAARTQFDPSGLKVKYVGPEGNELLEGFKDTYTRRFLEEGYRVIYIGNGLSDASPAKLSYCAFATGELVDCCREQKMACIPFDDLSEVVTRLRQMEPSDKNSN